MILEIMLVAPPKSQATASNENKPTAPQFSAPIIISTSAILFITVIAFFLSFFFSACFEPFLLFVILTDLFLLSIAKKRNVFSE